MSDVGKRYRCVVERYPAFKWGVGVCEEHTLEGCKSGWYTIRFEGNKVGLLAGHEIAEEIPEPTAQPER